MVFNLIRDVIEDVVRRQSVQVVDGQLEEILTEIGDHYLLRSFCAHVRKQLDDLGKIRVGIIDTFGPNTHGENVEDRLLYSVPKSLRDKIEICRFDVNHVGRIGALTNGAWAAAEKSIVALSVSGGLIPYNAEQLRQEAGVASINSANRATVFEILLGTHPGDYANAMRQLSSASSVVPVVTPIWNDGNITAAAFGANTIVTSIRGTNTARTEVPGLVDIYMNRTSVSRHTSQSAPMFIGQALAVGLVQ